MYIDNNKKYILVLGAGLTQGLVDTTIIADAKYSNNFSRSHRKLCSSLYYNGSSSFLFVNATALYQFKSKHSEMKPNSLF